MGYNSKEIKTISTARKLATPKDAIVSQDGQHKYAGQITKIQGDQSGTPITMKGVRDYLKGVDNLGNTQMMYPGAEYFFPGSSVTEYPMKRQLGGPTPPEDWGAFLAYNITAPENRQAREGWTYGDSNEYDHYGMWDALGKPSNFEEALKNNPDWVPNEDDDMYHGFSVNPRTGVWLKDYKAGEGVTPGSTGWMEANQHYLNTESYDNFNLVYDRDLERMRYLPKEKIGGFVYQPGGVTYGTPEYAAAYRQGKVARQVGDEFIMPTPQAWEDAAEKYAVTSTKSNAVLTPEQLDYVTKTSPSVDRKSFRPALGEVDPGVGYGNKYDEIIGYQRYPNWDALSEDQKRNINTSGPIGNAIKSKAGFGKDYYKENDNYGLSDFGRFLYESSPISAGQRIAQGNGDVWDFVELAATPFGLGVAGKSAKVLKQGSKALAKTNLARDVANTVKHAPTFVKDVISESATAGKLKLPKYGHVGRLEAQGFDELAAQKDHLLNKHLTDVQKADAPAGAWLQVIDPNNKMTLKEFQNYLLLESKSGKGAKQFIYDKVNKADVKKLQGKNLPESVKEGMSFGPGEYGTYQKAYDAGALDDIEKFTEGKITAEKANYILNKYQNNPSSVINDVVAVEDYKNITKFLQSKPNLYNANETINPTLTREIRATGKKIEGSNENIYAKIEKALTNPEHTRKRLGFIPADNLPFEEGGYMKKGGLQKQKNSKFTNKNIQSSINRLFKRNEMLFGPKGKKYYKPFAEGGSTNNINMKKLTDKEIAFPQQPTAAEFYARGFVPNAPVGFYRQGGISPAEAYPQQPPADIFFSGYPWQPKYEEGGPIFVQDNTNVATSKPSEKDLKFMADRLKQLKKLNLDGDYTTVAVPDRDSSFDGDSTRFYTGHYRNGKTPYKRDLGNLAGVSDRVNAWDILDAVESGAARVYQDTSAVEANRDWLGYRKGGMTMPEAFPQQPTAKYFFSGFPWESKYEEGGPTSSAPQDMNSIDAQTKYKKDSLLKFLRSNTMNAIAKEEGEGMEEEMMKQMMGRFNVGGFPDQGQPVYEKNPYTQKKMNYYQNAADDSMAGLKSGIPQLGLQLASSFDNFNAGLKDAKAQRLAPFTASDQYMGTGPNVSTETPFQGTEVDINSGAGNFDWNSPGGYNESGGYNTYAPGGEWTWADEWEQKDRTSKLRSALKEKTGTELNPDLSYDDLVAMGTKEGIIKMSDVNQGTQAGNLYPIPGRGRGYTPYGDYRYKIKGHSSAPIFSNMNQGTGTGYPNMSNLTPEQQAAMQQQYADMGFDLEYSEKKGLLRDALGLDARVKRLKITKRPGSGSSSGSGPGNSDSRLPNQQKYTTSSGREKSSADYDLPVTVDYSAFPNQQPVYDELSPYVRSSNYLNTGNTQAPAGYNPYPVSTAADEPLNFNVDPNLEKLAEENAVTPENRLGGLNRFFGGGFPGLNRSDDSMTVTQRGPSIFNPNATEGIMQGVTGILENAQQRNIANKQIANNQGADATFVKDQQSNPGNWTFNEGYFDPKNTGAKNIGVQSYMDTNINQDLNYGRYGGQGQDADYVWMTDEDMEQFMAMGGTFQIFE